MLATRPLILRMNFTFRCTCGDCGLCSEYHREIKAQCVKCGCDIDLDKNGNVSSETVTADGGDAICRTHLSFWAVRRNGSEQDATNPLGTLVWNNPHQAYAQLGGYHVTPSYRGEFCHPEDLSREGGYLLACHEAGFGYGLYGHSFYFREGRRAMTRAANAGLRAEGRRWYSLGIADGAAAGRSTRRRVGGAS